jgi:hypothetical protein
MAILGVISSVALSGLGPFLYPEYGFWLYMAILILASTILITLNMWFFFDLHPHEGTNTDKDARPDIYIPSGSEHVEDNYVFEDGIGNMIRHETGSRE